MALKMDRQVDATEIGYYLNEVAERGNVVCILAGAVSGVGTAGSGVALDSPLNVATVVAASSGVTPLGVLMNDFVNLDLSRTPLNWMKDQSQVGDKCTILRKGWCVTNRLTGAPKGGQLAVLSSSGTVAGVALGTLGTAAAPLVGRFLTGISEEGFARLLVDL